MDEKFFYKKNKNLQRSCLKKTFELRWMKNLYPSSSDESYGTPNLLVFNGFVDIDSEHSIEKCQKNNFTQFCIKKISQLKSIALL